MRLSGINLSGSLKIDVVSEGEDLQGLSIDNEPESMLTTDAPYQLEWSILPPAASGTEVEFSSSDENVATVSPGGLITPVAISEAEKTFTITISEKDAVVGPAEYTLSMRDTYGDSWNGATLVVTDSGDNEIHNTTGPTRADDQNTITETFDASAGIYTITVGGGSYDSEIRWKISGPMNTGSGFVDPDTEYGSGTFSVSLSGISTGISDTCDGILMINPDLVSSISMTPSTAPSLEFNSNVVLNVTVLPASALDKSVTWSIESGSEYLNIDSFDNTSATISSNALKGSGIIRVTSNENNSLYSEVHIHVLDEAPLLIIENPNLVGLSDYDEFGTAVSISNNYIIVGAPNEDQPDNGYGGAAYIFDKSTGTLLHSLQIDTVGTDSFGYTVAINDSYAVVGSYGDDNEGNEKVYVYNPLTGELLHTLVNPNTDDLDPSNDDFGGTSLGVSNNYIIVGASYEGESIEDSVGRAYLFNSSTGTLFRTMNFPDPYDIKIDASFGYSTAISETHIIVGAPYADTEHSGSGLAFVYNSTGILLHTLENPNPYGTPVNDHFGSSVALSESYAIVGTDSEDTENNVNAGAAYIYDLSTGNLLHTLLNDDPDVDNFGLTVGISDTYAIIGTSNARSPSGGSYSGRVFIYASSTGDFVKQLYPPDLMDQNSYTYFGHSVGIHDTIAVVGASQADSLDDQSNSGRVYVYDLSGVMVSGSLPSSFTMATDDTVILSCGVYPPSTPNKDVTWSIEIGNSFATITSSDNTSATIEANDSGGLEENVVVRATSDFDNTAYFEWDILVAIIRVTGVVIDTDPGEFMTNVDSPFQLTWTVSPANAYDQTVSFVSSNDSVATVSSGGLITPVAPGTFTVTITTTDGSHTDVTDTITVVDVDLVHSIDVNPKLLHMGYNKTRVLTCSIYPPSALDKSVTWSIVSGSGFINIDASDNTSATISSPQGVTGDSVVRVTSNENVSIYTDTSISVYEYAPDYVISNPDYSVNTFALAVDISDNYAVVGDNRYDRVDFTQADSGRVYISDLNGNILNILDNPKSSYKDIYFGQSVGISDNYVIVGSDNNNNKGEAYIFNSSTGALLHTLVNPDVDNGNGYSGSVGLSDNYAIVGDASWGEESSGRAYIYNPSTGALLHTIENPNPYGSPEVDLFGFSVAISNTHAIVGAYGEDDSVAPEDEDSTYSGKAYIYNAATGALLYTLDNPNLSVGDQRFGYSVDISDNYAIVGDYMFDASRGRAYIYDLSGNLLQTLSPPGGGNTYDIFGYSVSISDDYAFVGAYGVDSPGSSSGRVYLFDRASGLLLRTIDSPNYEGDTAKDYLGRAVGINSNNVAISGLTGENKALIYHMSPLVSAVSIKNPLSGLNVLIDQGTYQLKWTVSPSNAIDTSVTFSSSDDGVATVDAFGLITLQGGGEVTITVTSTVGQIEDNFTFNVITEGGLQPSHVLDNPGPIVATANRYGPSGHMSTNNYAIVGGPTNGQFQNEDVAYIYNPLTGQIIHKLDNPGDYGRFGDAVAINDNYAIVGAPHSSGSSGEQYSGKAYIFDTSTGELLHTLNNPNTTGTEDNDIFGQAVGISNSYAIVGTPERNKESPNNGTVYIFSTSDGSLLHTLDNPDSEEKDFGTYVGISESYAIVSCESGGYGYIYNSSTGELLHTIFIGSRNDVDITDTKAVVGREVYDPSTGELLFTTKYTLIDSVSITDKYVITANKDINAPPISGIAYIYDAATGVLLYIIEDPSSKQSDGRFGVAVGISENHAVITAPYEENDGGVMQVGKAYIYNL